MYMFGYCMFLFAFVIVLCWYRYNKIYYFKRLVRLFTAAVLNAK